jgi:hypothetical protein
MRDVAFGIGAGCGLKVLVGLFGGLVQEEDIVGLKFYYHELLA